MRKAVKSIRHYYRDAEMMEPHMTIDILSDTHFNSHFKMINPSKKAINGLQSTLAQKGKVLVLAGDIGDYNLQNINILKSLRELYYEHIILVLGNHDYYISPNSEYKSSLQRVAEFKKMVSNESGIYLLDGECVIIEGVRFGGAMG